MASSGQRHVNPQGRLCFVPEVPAWPRLEEFWPSFQEAQAAVRAFDQAVEGFAVPGVLGALFARHDAVQSSRAEGTTTTFSELLEWRAARHAPDPLDAATVTACAEAWDELSATRSDPILASRTAHRMLFRNAPPEHGQPGAFKTIANATPDADQPGGFFYFCPPDRVEERLDAWRRFTVAEDGPELVRAALSHWLFEHIHPFHDGNGRIGRLLIPVLVHASGATGTACCFCGEAALQWRTEYVEGLKAARRTADWGPWSRLMLALMKDNAKRNHQRLDELTAVFARWRRAAAGVRKHSAVHDLLARILLQPQLTVGQAVAALGAYSFQAVNSAVRMCETEGILTVTGRAGRRRLYAAPEILRIFA